MKILEPNTGEENIFIPKENIYVFVTDYGAKFLLKEVGTAAIQPKYYWVDLRERKVLNINEIMKECQSFEIVINRAINNLYCTVYEFDTMDEMVANWKNIKYVDGIKTVYKSKEV